MFIKAGRVSDVNWSCLDELLINVNLNCLGVFQKSSHSIPSMFARVHSGALFNSIDAFNLARTTATLCERCLITTESSSPLFLAGALPILFTCTTMDSDHAPRVSTGKGQKDRPASLHCMAPHACSSSYYRLSLAHDLG